MGTFTALLAAIRVHSTLSVAELLISRCKVDVNQPALYPQGRKLYPISCAMLNHVPPSTIELLLKHNLDLSRPDPRGRDHPLFLCVEHARMPLEYLRILVANGIDASVLNAKGQNALQALLVRQVDPANIRSKIRLLIKGGVDVRSPIVVGSVSSEKMSILHYIIHDGIAGQHRSDATSQIGHQLSMEFTEANYEHAKITFHRTKSLRSRESSIGSLQSLLSPGQSHSGLRARGQTVIGTPGSPTLSGTTGRSTLPRASEHSLRFSVSTNDLGAATNDPLGSPLPSPTYTSSPRPYTSSAFTTPMQHRSSPIVGGSEAQASLMVDVDTGLPSSNAMADIAEMLDTSPLGELAPSTINTSTQGPTLERQDSNGSTNTNTSTASFQTGRSQRSYATMSSHLTLPQETIKRLDSERLKQDLIDSQDLRDAIESAIHLISINFDPILAHLKDEEEVADYLRTSTEMTDDMIMMSPTHHATDTAMGEDPSSFHATSSRQNESSLFHTSPQHQSTYDFTARGHSGSVATKPTTPSPSTSSRSSRKLDHEQPTKRHSTGLSLPESAGMSLISRGNGSVGSPHGSR